MKTDFVITIYVSRRNIVNFCEHMWIIFLCPKILILPFVK